MEEIDAGQSEWRGQVQHVLSGQTRYFRDWTTLRTLMLDMLPDAEMPQREVTEDGPAWSDGED